MLPVEKHIISCVGCGNCENKCPVGAVRLKEDEEGFLYPVVENECCIQCGKCRIVCPMYQKHKNVQEPLSSYMAISKEKAILCQAASGGMFGTFAKVFLETYSNSAVAGAAYDHHRVEHKIIENKEDIHLLQNSKYVQSQLNDTFLLIENRLKNNENVLFSGTPCQVNALKIFLKREYDNLYTIDIICHGVPSYAFLEADLSSYFDTKTIQAVTFRAKNKTKPTKSYFILSVMSDNKEKHVVSNRDPYFSLFMRGDSYRESCYCCEFAKTKRVGDITIGDCDSHGYYPDFYPGVSVSTVLINTQKGKSLYEACSSLIEYCDLKLEREAAVNTQLSKPVERKAVRDTVYKELKEQGLKYIAKKYAKKRDLREKILLLKCLHL